MEDLLIGLLQNLNSITHIDVCIILLICMFFIIIMAKVFMWILTLLIYILLTIHVFGIVHIITTKNKDKNEKCGYFKDSSKQFSDLFRVIDKHIRSIEKTP